MPPRRPRRARAAAADRRAPRETGDSAARSSAIDEPQSAAFGAVDLRDCHRAIQRHHRARREREQLIVEREDLAPVGVAPQLRASLCTALIAACNLVGAGLIARKAGAQQRLAFVDPRAIPAPRSWSASRTNAPLSSTRAARRASMSSISASSPSASGSSRQQLDAAAARAGSLRRTARRAPACRRTSRCSPR